MLIHSVASGRLRAAGTEHGGFPTERAGRTRDSRRRFVVHGGGARAALRGGAAVGVAQSENLKRGGGKPGRPGPAARRTGMSPAATTALQTPGPLPGRPAAASEYGGWQPAALVPAAARRASFKLVAARVAAGARGVRVGRRWLVPGRAS